MSVHIGLCLVLVLALSQAATANDIFFCPVADTHGQEQLELQLFYLYRPLGLPAGGAVLQTGYYGVTDRLELNFHRLSFPGVPGNPAPQLELNAQYKVCHSTRPNRPAVAVGAYNLTGGPFLGYTGIQPYVAVSHNLNIPRNGRPKFRDPLVRGTLGVGAGGAHGAFGGILVVWDRRLATFVGTHSGRTLLGLNYAAGHKKQFDITAALFDGAPTMKVGYRHQF